MLAQVRETVAALVAELIRRPTYKVRETPAPDPITGDSVIIVEDIADGDVIGCVELRVRWIGGGVSGTQGQMNVALVDPFRAISTHRWRRRPTPIQDIVLLTDEWLIGMRAMRARRRSLEVAEAELHKRLHVASKRLGPTSLKTHRRGPLDITCDVVLRPKSLADTERLLDTALSPDERLRARVTIWVHLDNLTPDRVVRIVETADPFLRPVPSHDPTNVTPRHRRTRARKGT